MPPIFMTPGSMGLSATVSIHKESIFCPCRHARRRPPAQNQEQPRTKPRTTIAGTSQSTVSRIISKTAEVILQNSNAFVEWPNDEERSRIADRFLALTNIPGIIGAIDGVQVPMIAPKQNEYLFVNRKGRHAINVVAVSDHRRAFLWYSRAYPGSAHDSRIFRESRLHSELSSRIKKGVLLGDSAFQAERFLLKPVLDTPADSPESRYTEALCSGRVVVEHAFGVLKRQFSALHLGLRCEPDKAGKLIAAAMCLRNAAIAMKDPEFAGENEESDDQSDDDVDTSPLAPTASAFQQLIISRFV